MIVRIKPCRVCEGTAVRDDHRRHCRLRLSGQKCDPELAGCAPISARNEIPAWFARILGAARESSRYPAGVLTGLKSYFGIFCNQSSAKAFVFNIASTKFSKNLVTRVTCFRFTDTLPTSPRHRPVRYNQRLTYLR